MIILLVMALSLSLTACVEAPFSEPQEAAGPSIEAGEQMDHTLSVDIRDVDAEDAEEGAYWLHIEDENGIYLAISPEITVTSFKFVTVKTEETESGLQYLTDEERYSMDELTPDKPFLVKMQFAGMLPTYGIAFEDQNGRERFYTINMKGTGPEESYPYYLSEIE